MHVRPHAPHNYGDNSGRDYANAWNGLAAIDWSKVTPANPLVVSGHFTAERMTEFRVEPSNITVKSNPQDPAIFSNHFLSIEGCHGVRLVGLRFEDFGQVQLEGAKFITFDHCQFSRLNPEAIIAVELLSGCYGFWFAHCHFEYCGNAIYVRPKDNKRPANRLLVTDCTFEHIGAGEWETKDGHAVGIQGGDGHRIQNCRAVDTGTAFCLWASKDVPMTDCRIDTCWAQNCRKLAVASGSGFEVSGTYDVARDLPRKGWRSGIAVVSCVAVDCEGNGLRSNTRDAVEEHGNKFTRCADGARHVVNPFAGVK